MWRAFIRLSSCRQNGFSGPNAFVFSDLVSYTKSIYGKFLDEEDLEDFFHLIRLMDAAWLEEYYRKNKVAKTPTPRGLNGR